MSFFRVPVKLQAYRARTGERAHLALFTNSPAVCGTTRSVGEPLESSGVALRDAGEDQVKLCARCVSVAQHARRDA